MNSIYGNSNIVTFCFIRREPKLVVKATRIDTFFFSNIREEEKKVVGLMPSAISDESPIPNSFVSPVNLKI